MICLASDIELLFIWPKSRCLSVSFFLFCVLLFRNELYHDTYIYLMVGARARDDRRRSPLKKYGQFVAH